MVQLLPLTLKQLFTTRHVNEAINHQLIPNKWVNSTDTLLSREGQSYLSPAQSANLHCSKKRLLVSTTNFGMVCYTAKPGALT